MRLNELITEHVINARDTETKKKYGEQVWDMLQAAYASVKGGFRSASSLDELISDSGLWKIVVRAGKPTAINIYKDSHGRKSIAAATDNTLVGKRDYRMIKNADFKLRRAWAEVSGMPEEMLRRDAAVPIPAKYAGILTGKEILSINDDGEHYTRLIRGTPIEKIIFGFVEIDDKLLDKLKRANIDVKDLPDNFKPAV